MEWETSSLHGPTVPGISGRFCVFSGTWPRRSQKKLSGARFPVGFTLLLALTSPVAAQDLLPTSNGHAAAVYDVARRRLADFWPAIYRMEAPGRAVPDLLFDAYFGLRADGAVTWLTDVPVERAGYVPGTNVVEIEQRVAGRTIVTRWFAPWAVEAPAVAMWAEVLGARPGDTLLTLENLHLGRNVNGSDTGAEETLPVAGGAIREAGDRFTLVHRPLVPPAGVAAPPNNPFVLARDGRNFPAPETVERQVTDDAVIGFEFRAGADGVLRGGLLLSPEQPEPPASLTPDDERAGWEAWLAGLDLPEDTPLTRQQAAFLRMGQVRTPGGGHGQILASLPPGIWNISWVRDMAFSTAALARVGALEEAWAAIDFQLHAEVGDYVEYVGRPYLISVTRYYGNGREESDSNQNGPNIEWDDFGLFLWSVGRWEAAGGDVERLRPHWARVRSGVLEVLDSLVDDRDLLLPDSSIWERHWQGGDLNDGLRQRFAWSSITAAMGLCEAARLSEALGEPDADRWRALAHRLKGGITRGLVTPDGVLGASLEQVERGSGLLDLAVVEAFNQGIFAPDDPVAVATWAAVDRGLRVSADRGFKRNDDGEGRGGGPDQPGWYDEQEWVFIDLRTEIWRRAAGLPGADLTEMLRRRGDEGRLILPELLGVPRGEFAGAQPMIGFGAGAWLLGLGATPEPFCAPPGAVPGEDAGIAPDGGASPLDAGPGAPDVAAPLPDDAAAPGPDAPPLPGRDTGAGGAIVPPPQDAGPGTGPGASADAGSSPDGGGGGGCAVLSARPAPAPWLTAPLALLLLKSRRRAGGRRGPR